MKIHVQRMVPYVQTLLDPTHVLVLRISITMETCVMVWKNVEISYLDSYSIMRLITKMRLILIRFLVVYRLSMHSG